MHYSSVHEKLKFHHQSGMACYDLNVLTRPTGVTGDVKKPFEATEFNLESAKFKHSIEECTTLKCNQSINIRLRMLFLLSILLSYTQHSLHHRILAASCHS